MAGLSYAGKTSIIKRLLTGHFVHTEPTKGFDTELLERSNVQFQVVDLGGQDVFIHTLWKAFLPHADVLIFVIDAADQKTFIKARDVLHFSIGWNPNMPVLAILANKQDLSSAAQVDELLQLLNIPTIIAENNIKQFSIFGTSAKTGSGLEEAFSWLAKELTDQQDIPRINLKSVFLYKKDITGLSGSTDILLGRINFTETNDVVIAGIPVENFIDQMDETAIQAMELEDSTGEKYRLIKVENHSLSCFMLIEASEDSVIVRAIGEELLDQAVEQLESNRQLTGAEILEVLVPFVNISQEVFDSSINSSFVQFEQPVVSDQDIYEGGIEANDHAADKGQTTFFTKMSILDRIRVLEGK